MVVRQCDQMARLFVQYLGIVIYDFYFSKIAYNVCQVQNFARYQIKPGKIVYDF